MTGSRPAGTAVSVLIIEDEETAAETLRATLDAEIPDARVRIERDFDAAVDRMNELAPDVVVWARADVSPWRSRHVRSVLARLHAELTPSNKETDDEPNR